VNPTTFSELLTDISDEYIVSAANPHSKPIHWHQISAIAAGIVLLIAAAVYPKLRIQTPEITEPPESMTEVIAATTTAPESVEYPETQTAASPIQTTASSVTVTKSTTVLLSDATDTLETNASSETTQIQTDMPSETEPPVITTALTETTNQVTITEVDVAESLIIDEEGTIGIPIWQGSNETLGIETISAPQISCRFRLSEPDMDDKMRNYYGIPLEFDLTQHQCLLISIKSGYAMTSVIGGELTPEGLILKVIYLNQPCDLAELCYAIPLPANLTVEPENCCAECIESTEEEYQALLTDCPIIEIKG
jgi:hypothetical protein